MNKRWVKIAVGIIAVLILIVVLVPLFVNANTFRPTIEDQLSTLLGRKVTFDNLTFSLFGGKLVAQNIAIADDPAFSTNPFVKARKLNIGVEVMPLVFSRQVHITDFSIDSPAVQLIQNRAGKWNYSSIGGSAAKPESSQKPSAIPDLTVNRLSIDNGSVTVSSIPPTARPVVYSDVGVGVRQFSFAKSFPFQISASLPAGGNLKLTGTAGPLSQKDASDTPFRANLQIRHLDPVAAGLIEPKAGIQMIADIDAQASSDGNTASSTGKVSAAKLQLARTGSPAPQPVNIDYQVSDNLDARTGKVSDIAIHTGAVAAHVTGGFRFTADAVVLDLHLSAPNLPIDQLEQFLPVVGIHLPTGSSLHGGTLTANMAVTGPATESTIAGPVEIDNSSLAGFNLGSKIQGLNPLGGAAANATQIQQVKADLNSSPQTTQINNIYANVPAIGTATGSGTVSPSGALNFNLVAKFNSNSLVGSAVNTAVNSATNAVGNAVGGLVGGLLGKKPQVASNVANRGIPITITGTAQSPSIRANISAMLK